MARTRKKVSTEALLEKSPTGIRRSRSMSKPRKSSPRRIGRVYRFSLFVSGATLKSARAITNIKALCEKHLSGKYKIEVIDIYQQPERLNGDQVVAVPTLVKHYPLPMRRFIGDLSDTHRVLDALNIKNH
jgi:circadian clock protein KaiB